MVRPRNFDVKGVIGSAKEEFWEQGFEATGVSDLERATGLNRSSIYQAFGSKKTLFETALDAYIVDFVTPRIGPMERNGAGLIEVKRFFRGLGAFFEQPSAWRGCMWVNAIGELSGRNIDVEVRGLEYYERLRSAFRHALTSTPVAHPMSRGDLDRRARLLAAATLGIWLAARIDPSIAAMSCRAVVAEIDTW